ncbi:unnamed protein product, partial [Heligmosomoides polygyrus]|uniref:Ribosomal RNA-processing protein 40 n=1 Tax=Heligmosomoides polygyrus TaxID=6339 RepID=A0A183F200_HELPZ
VFSYGILPNPDTGALVVRQAGIFRHEGDKCWISVHSKRLVHHSFSSFFCFSIARIKYAFKDAPYRYVAEKGDRVIGIVTGSAGDFYKLDIGTPENATISFLAFEGATKRNRPDLKIGDIVFAQVIDEFAHTDVELTCIDSVSRARGLGALSGGFMFKVSCNLARRLLSSNSQLLKLLGKDYKFEITVGLNGRVWLKGVVHKEITTIYNIIKWSEYVLESDIPKYVEDEIRKSKGFPVEGETVNDSKMETNQ